MKKFLAILFGIILLVIYLSLIIVTFAFATIAKLMGWITGLVQTGLEKLKISIQY
jgi:hypothetical protein